MQATQILMTAVASTLSYNAFSSIPQSALERLAKTSNPTTGQSVPFKPFPESVPHRPPPPAATTPFPYTPPPTIPAAAKEASTLRRLSRLNSISASISWSCRSWRFLASALVEGSLRRDVRVEMRSSSFEELVLWRGEVVGEFGLEVVLEVEVAEERRESGDDVVVVGEVVGGVRGIVPSSRVLVRSCTGMFERG